MLSASRKEIASRLENFFLPDRLISASADSRADRFAVTCNSFLADYQPTKPRLEQQSPQVYTGKALTHKCGLIFVSGYVFAQFIEADDAHPDGEVRIFAP